MKILFIDQRYTAYVNGKVLGGNQFVVDKQIKLLRQEHHEIVFVTSIDSEECRAATKTIKCDVFSKHVSKLSGLEYNKKRNAGIQKAIAEEKPDIIINHDQGNNSVVKLLGSCGIPSITYVHNCTEVIGGIAGLGYVATLNEYVERGGMVVNVSETSMNQWVNYAKRYCHVTVPNPEKVFCNFHHTPWFGYAPFSESKEGGIMVSRMQKDKGILRAIKYHRSIGKPLTVCHPSPMEEAEEVYFKTCLSVSDESITFLPDLSRQELFKEISKRDYITIASAESFGIVAVEGAMMGLRTLLLFKGPHPVEETFRTLKHENMCVKIDPRVDKNHEFTRYPSDDKSLAIAASYYFSAEQAYNRFMVLIEKCLNNFEVEEIITL